MSRKLSQADVVLEYMSNGGTLTSLEALNKFGIISFPKRITELRRRGVEISDHWVTVTDRNGDKKSVKRYALKEKNVS